MTATRNALVYVSGPVNQSWIGPNEFGFLTLTGDLTPNNGAVLEDITRPGINGVAYRLLANRGEPFQIHTMAQAFGTVDTLNLLVYYHAAKGCLFTLRDGLGNTWYNTLVLDVQTPHPRRLATSTVGFGSEPYLVDCRWTLILAAAP